jgi:hypothetical protein
MSERFRASEASVARADHDVDQTIARLIECHLAAQNTGDIEIDAADEVSIK